MNYRSYDLGVPWGMQPLFCKFSRIVKIFPDRHGPVQKDRSIIVPFMLWRRVISQWRRDAVLLPSLRAFVGEALLEIASQHWIVPRCILRNLKVRFRFAM